MGSQFALPFRLSPNGSIAVVDQSTAFGRRDQVAHLLLTRPREREMHPSFGIVDPRFHGVDANAITTAVASNMPTFGIPKVTVIDRDDGTQNVSVDVA